MELDFVVVLLSWQWPRGAPVVVGAVHENTTCDDEVLVSSLVKLFG